MCRRSDYSRYRDEQSFVNAATQLRRGIDLPFVMGHLSGREPIVKPTVRSWFFVFIKEYVLTIQEIDKDR